MELPSHPESEEERDQKAPTGNRGVRIFIVVIVALLAAIVILHLTGVVGPGAQ